MLDFFILHFGKEWNKMTFCHRLLGLRVGVGGAVIFLKEKQLCSDEPAHITKDQGQRIMRSSEDPPAPFPRAALHPFYYFSSFLITGHADSLLLIDYPAICEAPFPSSLIQNYLIFHTS